MSTLCRFAAVAAFCFALPFCASPASAYEPPVVAPISDSWRKPVDEYAAGNRGLDYDTSPGSPVRASESGVVTFAGQVGGTEYVVIEHDDGLRTTYGGISAALVLVGEVIEAGARIALAGENLHFGVREGEIYIDPNTLLTANAYLVPSVDTGSITGRWVDETAYAWLVDEGDTTNAHVSSSHDDSVGSVLKDKDAWIDGATEAATVVVDGLITLLLDDD